MFSICFSSIAFSLPLPQEWGADVKSPGLKMRAPPSWSLSREKPRHLSIAEFLGSCPNSWLPGLATLPSLRCLAWALRTALGPSICPPAPLRPAVPVSGEEVPSCVLPSAPHVPMFSCMTFP